MSFFSSVMSATKAAAKATADFTKSVVDDLSSYPTSIACPVETCGTINAVPAQVWNWKCANEHVNGGNDVECKTCGEAGQKVLRPNPIPAAQITCSACEGVILVPTSKAKKHLATAATSTKKAAVATADYTKKTYNQMSARPTVITCLNEECKVKIAVPPERWAWTCPGVEEKACGTKNPDESKTCATCQQAKPFNSTPDVTVKCPQCLSVTPVPSVVITQKVQAGAAATKKAAVEAKVATENQVAHMRATPVAFNCENCNAKLGVPPPVPWVCQIAGCGTQNSEDIGACSKCNTKYTPLARCGVCNTVTAVPSNNLNNMFRSTKLSAKKGYENTKATAKFVGEHKEEIKAGAEFAKENPEMAKAAANAASK